MILNHLFKGSVTRAVAPGLKNPRGLLTLRGSKRPFHTKDSQAVIDEAPAQMRLGLIKVIAIVIPFTYFGAVLSKQGAEFLEEWNIFVPDDDDD